MTRRANYEILRKHRHVEGLGAVVLKDIGPHDRYLTITNAAEDVVRELHAAGELGDKRLFYIDTDGCLDELRHAGPIFTGFSSGPEGRTP